MRYAIRTVGCLLALGVAVLLAAPLWYPSVVRGEQADAARTAQHRLRAEVGAEPVAGTSLRAAVPVAHSAERGHGLLVMQIPRFGPHWRWVAVQGVDQGSLANGPGHYAWTPLPGARGNVAFAGHRAGHGDPFIDFDRLRPGDQVRMRQGGTRWTYRITMRPVIIPVTDARVLAPLPGRRLTLTTCWPKYGHAKRMYVHAVLTHWFTSR